MTMEAAGCEFEAPKSPDLYIAPMGERAQEKAALLCDAVRRAGYSAEFDLIGRGIKPQMRYADKIKAKFVVVIGDNELDSGEAKLKNMKTGAETPLKLEDFISVFNNLLLEEMFGNSFTEDFGNIINELPAENEIPEDLK